MPAGRLDRSRVVRVSGEDDASAAGIVGERLARGIADRGGQARTGERFGEAHLACTG